MNVNLSIEKVKFLIVVYVNNKCFERYHLRGITITYLYKAICQLFVLINKVVSKPNWYCDKFPNSI
jgi:hypothetical protein